MKASQRVYQYYTELPTYAKAVVVIGAGVIAWFGIINPVRKLIVGKLNMTKMAKEGKEARQTLQDLAKKGIRPTITEAQAQSFSNSLVSAFGGCGTDETAVYGVMAQMKNDADVYLLLSTYGIRKYDECGYWTGDIESSLSAAMSDELDMFEKAQVNAILKKNGVSFQFT